LINDDPGGKEAALPRVGQADRRDLSEERINVGIIENDRG
jgi:hypothetical protein